MRTLSLKITLYFLVVSLAAIALAAVLLWSVTAISFNRFVLDQRQAEFVVAVTQHYEQTGSWEGIASDLQQWGLLPPPGAQGTNNEPSRQPFALTDRNGVVIIGGGPFTRGEILPSAKVQNGIAIHVQGYTVGVVITTGQNPEPTAIEQLYQSRVKAALLISAFGGAVLAIVLGVIFPRSLTRPIHELTDAARAMESGRIGQKVSVRTSDELGQLAQAFNQMSSAIADAHASRRQMTADIAHELRNPLTVIAGYLESMSDGVLKPDKRRIETLFNEVKHLQAIVEDLRTLSMADGGGLALNYEMVDIKQFLSTIDHVFEPIIKQDGITMIVKVGEGVQGVDMDPGRMQQVLENLLTNSIKNTHRGGRIVLSAHTAGKELILSVQDNGNGIAPQDLPHLFERFYKGDESRHDSGSGLGLAIAKTFVELHAGRLQAVNNPGGRGCTFTIILPLRR
jgi:two-component system sensor histidine kinase BaeS